MKPPEDHIFDERRRRVDELMAMWAAEDALIDLTDEAPAEVSS